MKVEPDYSKAAAYKGAQPKPNDTGRVGGEMLLGTTDTKTKTLLGA